MAQLSQREKEHLKHQGIYAKWGCDGDGCQQVIGPLAWNGHGNKKVYCSSECRQKNEGARTRPYKEHQAPTTESLRRTCAGEKVLGIAAKGSTKGNILERLIDGKEHLISSLKSCREKPDDSIGWRLTWLKEKGPKAEPPFQLNMDEKKVQLAFLGKQPTSSNGQRRVAVKDAPVA